MGAPSSSIPISNAFFFVMTVTAALVNISQAKQTQIVYYMHQDPISNKPSEVVVAGRNGSSTSLSNFFEFGTVFVADIPLTDGPEKGSKEIGRLQGTFMNTQLDGKGFFMSFSVVFTDGEFKGSSLQIQGSDLILAEHREFGVVAGTGYFRFVNGYGIMETVAMDFDKLTCLTKVTVTVNHDDHLEGMSICSLQ